MFSIGVIASGGDYQTVQVWNAITGQHIVTCNGHTAIVLALAWSPDGRYRSEDRFPICPLPLHRQTEDVAAEQYPGEPSETTASSADPDQL